MAANDFLGCEIYSANGVQEAITGLSNILMKRDKIYQGDIKVVFNPVTQTFTAYCETWEMETEESEKWRES